MLENDFVRTVKNNFDLELFFLAKRKKKLKRYLEPLFERMIFEKGSSFLNRKPSKILFRKQYLSQTF